MAIPKSVKKCLRAAKKAARKFTPAIAAQVQAKCFQRAGVNFDGVRRKRHSRRKHRR